MTEVFEFRPAQLCSFLILGLLLCSFESCVAQRSLMTWNDLEQLQPGTPLIVDTGHRLACTLVEVNREEIVCERLSHAFAKNRVLEVRFASRRKSALVGALVGGAAGGALATTSSGGSEGVKVAAGAGLGSLVGGLVGWVVGHSRGEVIYRQ